MTVLIAGGDSFTYGSELPSQDHAWANLLATRKGWNICNTAKPGYSNSAIRRNVMNAVHKYRELDLFVAVMWSFPNRYEFRFAYDTGHKESPWYSINPWTYNDENFEEHFFTKDDQVLVAQQANRANAEAKGMTAFAKSYVQNVAQTEYWEIYNSWCEIVMLQNYLIKHNIPYIFTQVDNSLFECNSEMDGTLRTLRADIDMTKFIMDEGMFTWAQRTQQPFYTTHPQEIAHTEWINILYDRIDHGHT
jgi:hypothetical protein